MSFISYEYLRSLGFDKKTNLYSREYEITDSEWVEVVVGALVGALAPAAHRVGVGIGVSVIEAYEKRNESVAPNLVLAFQYIAKRYGYTIEEVINWNKQYNPKYPKYEQEVQDIVMSNKKKFVVPVLVTVVADDYEEAVNDTIALLGACQFNYKASQGLPREASVLPYYEIPTDFERDNDNQRVVYLHNEEEGIE